MSDSVWMLFLLAGAFIAYVALKVIVLNRKSKREWERTDKSKLKKFGDEDNE